MIKEDKEKKNGRVAGESIFNPEKAKEYVQDLLGVSDSERNSGINWKSPRVVASLIIALIALAVIIGFIVGLVYKKQKN